MTNPNGLLERLGVPADGPGAWAGDWIDGGGPPLESIDPTTGAALGRVRGCARPDYDAVVEAAEARFLEWRMRPAPRRGELVRRLGELLREHKQALGELVSREVGKIRAEGLGEVQEMIDI